MPAAGLVLLATGGAFKGTTFGATIGGVDTTIIAATLTAWFVATQTLATIGRRESLAPLLAVLGVALVLVMPGIFQTGPVDAYSVKKVSETLPLVVLSMLGGVAILRNERRRQAWVVLIACFGITLGIMAIVSPDAIQAQQGALAAAGSNTIALGRASGASVIVLATFALAGRMTSVRRLALVGILLVAIGFMVASGSRGPVLAAVTSLSLVAAFTGSVRRRGLRVLLTALAIGCLGSLVIGTRVAAERLTSVQDTSAQARLSLWQQSFDLLQKKPSGVGWGGTANYLDTWLVTTSKSGEIYPHNVLLEIGVEGGWVALLAFLCALGAAYRLQRREAKTVTERAILGLLLFTAINAMVSGDIGDNRAMWVALGACLVWLGAAGAGGEQANKGWRRSTEGLKRTRVPSLH